MKNLIFSVVLLMTISVSAQKYFTKTGITEFKASVEAFEPVEAVNKSTTAILNVENGDIAGLLFLKAFHFKVALMQEHFNENYMDSDKYPKATFKGRILDFSFDELTEDGKLLKLDGVLNLRGKDKAISTIAKLTKVGDKIQVTSTFSVEPQDFDIKIPGIVKDKIAKTINVRLNYELIEKK
ncbi:YceI family protein [Winogradskyella sp. 3972H.M.0a.05]|uniref:YceI family protein n=1 Tax=Winogradskyella sp. 3972H.M.0a.05 TaxID=2950277 RepID=UPI00339607F9